MAGPSPVGARRSLSSMNTPMATYSHSLLRLLGRSSLGSAIAMTLLAGLLASLLPLDTQARARPTLPSDAQPVALATPQANQVTAHERHW